MGAKNTRPRTCRTCGAVFPGGPRAWYCPDCRAARHTESAAAYRERKRAGNVRKIGSTDTCANCGQHYIVVGSNQRYCEKCAHEKIQELDRVQGMQYYEKNKDEINLSRRISRRKENLCQSCGRPIPAVGGRLFCSDCEKEGKRKRYAVRYVDRNIVQRGQSYIVQTCTGGKRYYVGSTTDRDTAFRLRDEADAKIKAGCFLEWIKIIKKL